MPRTHPTGAAPRGLPAWPSYLLAAVIGCWAALAAFPRRDLLGGLPPGLPIGADPLQHIAGELYFLAEPWHWPLFEVHGLDGPHGVNIALTDSIPLVAVLLKLLHPAVPALRQGIGPWLGLAWLLQPVAAVYALRGTGERGLVAALAVAAMAAAMPTFLIRVGHAALDGHFLLLLALGLYLRATGAAAGIAPVAMLSLLIALALFIHPYLMAMVAAVAAAVPVTLAVHALLRRRSQEGWHVWRRPVVAGAIVAAGIILAALLARLFGYLGGSVPQDYGRYSMNLAAPFWPAPSRLAPRLPVRAVDATGGQIFEGFQYLGGGVLLLLLAVVVRRRGRAWLAGCAPLHAGLLLAMAALSAYAVSTHAYLFHHSLLHLRAVPPGGRILRASGRLFWPVAYTLLLVGVRGVSRAWPRAGAAVLLAAAALQLYDSSLLRIRVHDEQFFANQPEDATQSALDDTIARYDAVTLVPRLECDGAGVGTAMPVIFLAARHAIPVNTMYAARIEAGNGCDGAPGADARRPLARGALGVAYGPTRAAQRLWWRGQGLTCADLDPLTLCAADGAGLAMLAPTAPGTKLPPGEMVTAVRRQLFGDGLAAGWGPVEAWGAWAVTPHPELRLHVAPSGGAVRVTLRLRAPPGIERREISVRAGGPAGRVVATWTLGQQDRAGSVVLAPGEARAEGGQVIALALDAGPIVTLQGVPRRFGIGLVAVAVDTVAGR